MLPVVSKADRRLPAYLATAAAVTEEEGFYAREWDGDSHFRWMGSSASLAFQPASEQRYLEFSVFSEFYDLSQELTIAAADESLRIPLTHGWMQISVPIPVAADTATLAVNKLFPRTFYPTDDRSLGVRVKAARLHADPERHEHVARQHANAWRNTAEMLAGASELKSTPPSLGIDVHGTCNVKPPCVYCEWDVNKELEGANVDAPFTRETLEDYGAFFDNAQSLTNCSIGEPFMMKDFDELLEIFGLQGKLLELTTNGQILTDRNIERLLGRSIDLYISLDAGTQETYAKLRNDKWERILVNLRRLIDAKKATQGLPRIHLVFMPMRVNVDELEAFVRLCADLGVDRMVLRPLNYSDSIDLRWERNGYVFDYEKELLPFNELVAASASAAALCRTYDVVLSDQMDFGSAATFVDEFTDHVDNGSPVETVEVSAAEPAATESGLGEELQPICMEPWKKLYILRRGVLPCSYGSPLAAMKDYRSAWNSDQMGHLRKELAAHRFPTYCLDAPACPIVRRHIHASALPFRQRVFVAIRSAWQRFDRATAQGWRAKLALPAKKAIRLVRATTKRCRW